MPVAMAGGASALVLCAAVSAAEPTPSDVTLEHCAAIEVALQRLACYDAVAGRGVSSGPAQGSAPGLQLTPSGQLVTPVAPAAVVPGTVAGSGLAVTDPPVEPDSTMSAFWELDDKDKRGTFRFLSYKPNYVLPVHVTSDINETPSGSTGGVTTLPAYKRTELKLQISLRTKVAQGLFVPNGDLWFAYTQMSLWQIWNKQESSPFRATDYEPEAVYVLAVPKSLRPLPLGWQFRMVKLGIAHQSNGQADPLSRSWNRVYGGVGLENGDVSLVAQVWRRLRENASTDDNPDLIFYRGHGDIALNWTPGKATASLTWRTNFRNMQRGAWQFDWTYPVRSSQPKGLRWYVQVFSGYGETLLDYNFRQTSVGAGLSLFEF